MQHCVPDVVGKSVIAGVAGDASKRDLGAHGTSAFTVPQGQDTLFEGHHHLAR
jgi:hypothetical protein